MGVEIAHDLVIALGIEVFEAGILQLPFDLLHAEPVGQRRIDVHGLAGLGDLLFRALELHGAGVVQAVGDLDEDDADVLAHGHEHLAQVLHLLLLERGILHARQLCDALDERGDRRAKIAGDIIVGRVRVLDAVVQQRAEDRIRIEADLRDDLRHSQRMDDIGRAVLALLVLVLFARVVHGAVDEGHINIQLARRDGALHAEIVFLKGFHSITCFELAERAEQHAVFQWVRPVRHDAHRNGAAAAPQRHKAELGQDLQAGNGAARRLRPGRRRRDLQAEAVGIVPQLRAAGGRTAEEVPHADDVLAVWGQCPQLVGACSTVRPLRLSTGFGQPAPHGSSCERPRTFSSVRRDASISQSTCSVASTGADAA